MDFDLTEDQKVLGTMVREYADSELAPIAAEVDEKSRFPAESYQRLAELKLTGLGLPEQYGGTGGGFLELVIATEEISRVCAALGTILFVTTGLVARTIYEYGDEDQRKRFVTPLAKGEKIASFALTEAGAGSDVASIQTTATRHNNGYLINGTKIFITNGNEAGTVLVFATVDKSLRHKGITAFIVERETPGFSVGRIENKLGIRASSTAELIFKDCFVPESNRLGKEDEGLRMALSALDASRVTVAAQSVGIAQGAFDKALAYAKGRQQFGQPIANFQAIQWMLADIATQIDAARFLTYRVVHLIDNGRPFSKEASMAKLFASEIAMSVTAKTIQIQGGHGYIRNSPLERYFRDAKVTEIYEGTSEMQRMTIARSLMREG